MISKLKELMNKITKAGLLHFVRNDNTRKKVAFTLAEVLITLGIIGVVAALTLPTLNRKIQNQIFVTKIKKEYATIQQAFLKMKADSETDSITDAISPYFNDGQNCTYSDDPNSDKCKNILNFLGKYFKISSIEPVGSYNTIKRNWVKRNQHNYYVVDWPVSGYKIVLSDGSYIFLYAFTVQESSRTFEFSIDINGGKGPNAIGIDVFPFMLYKKGQYVDFYDVNKNFETISFNCKEHSPNDALYCGAYLKKNNWKMDY